jgi:drug/metabolite transporter (DMT)-like permease
VDYTLTLVAALLLGVGFVLQQHAAEQAPKSHFLSLKLVGDLFRKRLWLAGIVAMILGQILAAWSIGHLELSIVEPLLTTNLLFALILAVPLSHQAVRVTEVGGAVLLIAGEGLLEVARSAQPIGRSIGSFSHWPAAALIAGVAFAAVQAGRQRSDRRRATLTGLGAGLVFGIQDALTRQTLQILQHHGLSGLLQSWSMYCLVATGAVGVLLMQYAFSAGPLHASLPTIAAGEPVAGILLGIVVFGDRIALTPSSLALQAGGLFALVVGVVLVARAPALANLRKAVTEPVHRPLPHPHFPALRPDAAFHGGRLDATARHRHPHPIANGARPGEPADEQPGASAREGDEQPDQPGSPAAAPAPAPAPARPGPVSAGPGLSPTRRPGDSRAPRPPDAHHGGLGPVTPPAPAPIVAIGPLTPGPLTPGLMAPAEPPMAVPPDSPLEPL